jgi:hypothetical protein
VSRIVLVITLVCACARAPEPSTPAPSASTSASPPSASASSAPPPGLISSKWEQAKIDVARSDCKTLVMVVDTYKLNHPGTQECPTVDVLRNEKALAPDADVVDPWGHPYRIVCGDDETGVASAGPDGAFKTADDIWGGARLPQKL